VGDSRHVAYQVELYLDVHPYPDRQTGEGIRALSKLLPPKALRKLVVDPGSKSVNLVVASHEANPARALTNLLRVVEVVMLQVFPDKIGEISSAIVTRLNQQQLEELLKEEDAPEGEGMGERDDG
jgi:hypothetical protein